MVEIAKYGPNRGQTVPQNCPNGSTLKSILFIGTDEFSVIVEPFQGSRSKHMAEIATAWPLYGTDMNLTWPF